MNAPLPNLDAHLDVMSGIRKAWWRCARHFPDELPPHPPEHADPHRPPGPVPDLAPRIHETTDQAAAIARAARILARASDWHSCLPLVSRYTELALLATRLSHDISQSITDGQPHIPGAAPHLTVFHQHCRTLATLADHARSLVQRLTPGAAHPLDDGAHP